MIDIQLGATRYEILCNLRRPGIYLDHLAFRELSDTRKERDKAGAQLLEYLKHHGTLLYSSLNLLELASNSGQSSDDGLSFLEEVGPRWCPLDVSFGDVIEREEAYDPAAGGNAPFYDERFLLNLIPEILRLRPDEIRRPSLATVAITIRESEETRADLEAALDMVKSLSEVIRKNQARWKTLHTKIKRRASEVPALTDRNKTAYVENLITRKLMNEEKWANWEENDITDLMHVVVPVAHADFVVLDKSWAGLVEELKLPPAFAKVFRLADLRGESFLQALRDFRSAAPMKNPPGSSPGGS